MKIKNAVKNAVRKYPKYSSSEIIDKIKKYEYVSFDVFDTLVKRYYLEPTDLFLSVAEIFNNNNVSRQINLEKFKTRRINAEKICRNSKGKEEITLDDIYTELKSSYADICDLLKQIEIHEEINSCYANPIIKSVYDWCVNNNKKIIIISDMYLPTSIISSILQKCGFSNFEKIYVSSEYNRTKRNGMLYKQVVSDFGIRFSQLIHIGDNIIGDYLTAMKLGIRACKIATNPNRTKYYRGKKYQVKDYNTYEKVRTYVSGCVSESWNEYFRCGYEVYGIAIYSFCRWLHSKLLCNGINNVYFLSRDGYLLMKSYLELFPLEKENVRYLHVSRKSLRLPQVCAAEDLKMVMSTFRPFAYVGYKEIAYGLGVDDHLAKEKWLESGLDVDKKFLAKDFSDDSKCKYFYSQIQEEVLKSSKEASIILSKYLNQEGFVGKVAIVDIGWAGTLQRCLNRITAKNNHKVEIHGFYFGMTPDSHDDINAEGYISPEKEPYSLCVGAIECAFPASEGTTIGYYEDECGKIIPTLQEYEHNHMKFEDNVIKEIQSGVLYFIKHMSLLKMNNLEVSNNTAYINLELFTKHPKLEDTKLLGDFEFHDGELTPLAKPKSILCYLKSPNLLKTDFMKCTWKTGFVRRLLILNAPYYKILSYFKQQKS